jgi:NAD(P)-dependent dehydrogenase (short-subunit alcohol dehydrogenase family)
MAGTVVVTGASTGIGRACALHLDGLGFEVFAGIRREKDGEVLQASASERLRPLMLDVTEGHTIDGLVEAIGRRRLVGLVNNAGIAVGGPLEFVPLKDLRLQLEVNVVGLVAVTQALLGALRTSRGRIVNIGSVGGRHAVPFVGPYAASKHAVEAISDSLRQELRPWGMHVALIEPGAIATPIWEKGQDAADAAAAEFPSAALALYGNRVAAFRRLTERLGAHGLPPERVAQAIEHALTAPKPRTRYVIGAEARGQVTLKRLLPDRAMDSVTERLMRL